MIPDPVLQGWVKNKRRIQDRLNRINKRIKKLDKQKRHFEMRMRAIQNHEKARFKESCPEEVPVSK
jgi:hypothetical protein